MKYFFAFTPAGSMVYETKSKTFENCKNKLLKFAKHMPYKSWDNFKKRGYEIEELDNNE